MSSLSTVEIRLTKTKEVIDALRRRNQFQKDEHDREFYTVKFNGESVLFWHDQVRSVPKAWADAFMDIRIRIDEKCLHCKGMGSTIAGLCTECKGTKWVDTNKELPLFKRLTVHDPLSDDLNSAPPLKSVGA